MLELYKNIRQRRLALGMTQQELADKVGYTSKSMIARIERGDVNLPQSKIKLFSDVLGVAPSDLMGFVEDSFMNSNQQRLLDIFNSMSEEGQKVALNVLYGLATQYPADSEVIEA